MLVQTGKRYFCPPHGTTLIVTKAGKEAGAEGRGHELTCEGVALEEGMGTLKRKPEGEKHLTRLGIRYTYPKPPEEGEKEEDLGIRTDVLCLMPGDCVLGINGVPMFETQPKVLPSAEAYGQSPIPRAPTASGGSSFLDKDEEKLPNGA
jgi:hypothetical protein